MYFVSILMLHYIFVNDTGNISDNFTVRLIIFFRILHEDSYTISTSTGQKNETDVITTDLLSFRIKISRSGFMTYFIANPTYDDYVATDAEARKIAASLI